PIKRHYKMAKKGEPSALVNSFGFIELFLYMDNISEKLNIRRQQEVLLVAK
ncbi:MAG: hypothetical protein D6828_03240, partial [Nitrospirae bacterium]